MVSERELILQELKETNKGSPYINCNKVIYDYSSNICELFVNEIKNGHTVYVGGLADGAIGIASAINAFYTRFDKTTYYYPFFVRKTEKNGRFIEQCFSMIPVVNADSPAIIVDDVLTTGYSIAKAAAAINREWGYKPTLAVVLVDNEMGGKQFLLKKHGIECRSIFTRKEILG